MQKYSYHIGYVMIKSLSHIKINSVNPLSLIINKINGYIEKGSENKYQTLVPTDESKETLKTMKNYGTKPEILLGQVNI